MKIGEAAKETGLSISNIRFYEKKGLLEPEREAESRYRNYTQEDILRLKKIIVFRKMDLSVEQIDAMLKGRADAREVLKNQEQELFEKMKELEGALELCRVLEKEASPLDMEPEKYLNYIAQEEQKGKKFSKAEELLDSMLESAEALSGGQTLYLLGRPAAVFIYKSGELLEGSGILKQGCYQISCEIHFGILYPYFGEQWAKE